MGNEEAILRVGKAVDEVIGLIRSEEKSEDSREAIRFLLESAKATKEDDFGAALEFTKKARERASPETYYMLSKAKEFAAAAENKFGNEKYDKAIELWNKALEEYLKAGKFAEMRNEGEILENISVVEKILNGNIERAKGAKEKVEMIGLVRKGNVSVEEANGFFRKGEFEGAKKAYGSAEEAFKKALEIAEKKNFEADREKISGAVKSVETSLEAVLLSEGDFMLEEAEKLFKAGEFEEAEKSFSGVLNFLKGLTFSNEELEAMQQSGRERLVMSKLGHGREKMRVADLLVENVKYYEAKTAYKDAESFLEALHKEASKYGFKNLVEELEKLSEACKRNISEVTGALMDVSGMAPPIMQVDGISRGEATFKRSWGRLEERGPEPEEVRLTGPSSPEDLLNTPDSTENFPQKLRAVYEIFEMVGEGGFAKVFRAKRREDEGKRKDAGKIVALKVPRIDAKTGADFINEVAAWLNLNHPNIVKLQRADFRPVPYIEVEYVEGVTAKGKLVRELEYYPKPLPENLAVQIIHDTARGLKHAHSKGIYHHDIKPLNILLQPEEGNSSKEGKIVPKITDFGLAKISARSSHSSPKGISPLYAAPEQFDEEAYGGLDQRTDIYQLGVTFFEMLSGESPYKCSSPVALMGKICSPDAKARLVSELKPELASYDGIFEKMLAKKKEDRFQNMSEFLKALEALDRIREMKIELKKSLEITKESIKFTKDREEIRKLKIRLVEKSEELTILHALSNNKAELINSLNDLKNVTKEHREELLASASQIEIMLRERIAIGEDFAGGLKILMHDIRREVESR